MPYCPDCGAEVQKNDTYCSDCGWELQKSGSVDTASKERETPSKASEIKDESTIVGNSDAPEDIGLMADEEILEMRRPTLWKWAGTIVLSLILAVIGLYTIMSGNVNIGVVSLIFSSILGYYIYYISNYTRYIVTDRRVIKYEGFMGTETTEVRLEDIRNLQTSKEWGYEWGEISISTATADDGVTLEYTPEADEFANTIRRGQEVYS